MSHAAITILVLTAFAAGFVIGYLLGRSHGPTHFV